MWSSGPGLTWSEAVPVLPDFVPVTAWEPATEAVQTAPLQEPFGPIVKVVLAVTSPSELSYWSRPCAVYACVAPAVIDVAAGASARWSSGPGLTISEAVLVWPRSVPVPVCAPALVVVHVLPLHEPWGAMVKVVLEVTLPSRFPAGS